MHSKAMAVVAITLLAVTPIALCSCGDQKPTTADSAGTPAGWTGRRINMNDPKGVPKPGAAQPGDQTATANK